MTSSRERRTREETRALMLEAGYELACELLKRSALDGPSVGLNPISAVKLTDVAARATSLEHERGRRSKDDPPITTGAIYPIWEDQAAYHRGLAIYIAERHAITRAQLEQEMLRAAANNTDTLRSAARAITEVAYRTLAADPTFPLTMSLVAATGDPAIREAMLHRPDSAGAVVSMLDMSLRVWDVQTVEPFTIESLYRCFRAMVDGLLVQRMLDPDYFEAIDAKLASVSTDDQEEAWTLLSHAAYALLRGFLDTTQRPSPSSTPRQPQQVTPDG